MLGLPKTRVPNQRVYLRSGVQICQIRLGFKFGVMVPMHIHFLPYLLPMRPKWHRGINDIFPTLRIFSQFFNGAPAVIELP